MCIISYSEVCQNLLVIMMKVVEDYVSIFIICQNGEVCVLMLFEEYNLLEETVYLLCFFVNVWRLMDLIDSLKLGKGMEKDIIE